MLDGLQELVTVTVPAGGIVDRFTQEQLIAGAPTVYSVEVVWLGAPERKLAIDASSGRPLGMVQTADVQALYQHTGAAGEIDWLDMLHPGVTVTRARDSRVYALTDVRVDPFTSNALLYLSLLQGGT